MASSALIEPQLVDAAEVARYLGVRPEWVRANAELLGVRRLGNSRRPRLRFNLAEVEERLSHEDEAA